MVAVNNSGGSGLMTMHKGYQMVVVAILLLTLLWILPVQILGRHRRQPPYHADTFVVQRLHSKHANAGRYLPSPSEQYVVEHSSDLGYDTKPKEPPGRGCTIWTDPDESAIYQDLQTFRSELKNYWDVLQAYSWVEDQGVKDIRKLLAASNNPDDVCAHLELDPRGRSLQEAFFAKSSSLSTVHARSEHPEFVEPLLPPMRHPDICWMQHDKKLRDANILDVKYLVHDFAAMCRRLKPGKSRLIMLDIGASPQYAHAESPWFAITELYQRFGFHFDHVYAYELKPFDTADVYERVPKDLHNAYHWINAGASTERGHALNPWTMLENGEFTEDDFIVVKLDIDTPSVEIPLAYQLLTSPRLLSLVDHFYFEHHVQIEEQRKYWSRAWSGSIHDTLHLFQTLRLQGVASHFWV